MSEIRSDEFLAIPVGELACQPADWLYHLQEEVNRILAVAKAMDAHLHSALDRKYAELAHHQRMAQGKDTGVVHLADGSVRITVALPKKVEWDQDLLGQIAQRIAATGDDPRQFLDISYRVSETRFNAWPESLQTVFYPARTVKPGKPSFRLTVSEEK